MGAVFILLDDYYPDYENAHGNAESYIDWHPVQRRCKSVRRGEPGRTLPRNRESECFSLKTCGESQGGISAAACRTASENRADGHHHDSWKEDRSFDDSWRKAG